MSEKPQININKPANMTDAEANAWAAIQPHVLGAGTAYSYTHKFFKGLEPSALSDELRKLQDEVLQSDNLEGCEALLVTQANLLNIIFNSSMQKAAQQENLKGLDIYMKQGLKAQAQCRQTVEALASLRNPVPNVLRQTNITNGPQQVNNGITPDEQSKLSAEPGNTHLAAVETIDGTALSSR
jgi:hypothetical protein